MVAAILALGLSPETLGQTTATVIASSENPSTYGQSVAFIVTVNPVPESVNTPGGNVELRVNGNLVATLILSSGLAISPTFTLLSANTHAITANYLGDFNFSPSLGTLAGGQKVTTAVTPTGWVTSSGGAGDDLACSMASDAAGNAYVSGYFSAGTAIGGSSFTSNGGKDAFVGKIDASGNWIWVRRFGSTGHDMAYGVAVDAVNNVYITGTFQATVDFDSVSLNATGASDLFVVKLNSSGNVVWAKKAGGQSGWANEGKSIKADGSGNVVVSGFFGRNGQFGALNLSASGNYDGFVTKLDSGGNFLWAQRTSSPGDTDTAFSVALDSIGNVYVAGMYAGSGSFGSLTLTGLNTEGYVGKVDRNTGDFLWVKTLGGSNGDYAFAVASDSTNNVYVTGAFNTQAIFGSTTLSGSDDEVFVTKLSSNGDFVWASKAGGSSADQGTGLAVDENGRVLVTGTFQGTGTFGSTTLTSSGGLDAFMAVLDDGGNFLLAQKGGGTGSDLGKAIAKGSNGNAYMAGSFEGSGAFLGTTLVSAGSSDFFVLKSVVFLNKPPSFTKGAEITTTEDIGSQTIANWATNVRSGPSDEPPQALTFLVSNNNLNLFAVQPAISPAGTLTFTTANHANGAATVTVRLRDDGGTNGDGIDTSDSQTFVITVQSVNDAPQFSFSTNVVSVLEDAGLITVTNLALNISRGPADEFNQTVTFSVQTTNASFFAIQPTVSTNGTLSFATATNVFGTNLLTVFLRDNGPTTLGGTNQSSPQTLSVVAAPVNDPPTFSGLGPFTTFEDTSTNLLLTVTDVDSPAVGLALSATSSNTELVSDANLLTSATSTNWTLSITPQPNANGTNTIRLVVADEQSARTTNSFLLTIQAVNDPPAFNLATNFVSVPEDAGLVRMTNFAFNINSGPTNEAAQTLSFSVATTNTAFFASPPTLSTNGTFSFTAATNISGIVLLTVRLSDSGPATSDGTNQSAPQTFSLVVTPANDPPFISVLTALTILEDTSTNLTFAVTDVDGPAASIAVGAFSSNLNLVASTNAVVTGSGTNWTVSIIPQPNANGAGTISVVAFDDQLTRSTNSIALTVQAVNDAPSFLLTTNFLRVTEDAGLVRFTNFITGILPGPPNEADQAVTFSVTGDAQSFFAIQPALTTNGILSFSTSTNTVGTNLITVLLRDSGSITLGGTNQSAPQSFSLVVTPINDPPAISGLKPVSGFEDTSTNLAFVVTDIDSDPATVTITASSSNPYVAGNSGLVVTGSGTNRLVSMRPQSNANGSSTIQLVATDDQQNRSTNSFLLTVQAVNDPPSFVLSTNRLLVLEDAGAVRLTNIVVSVNPGPNEPNQTLSISVTTTNPAFFAVAPALTTNGLLTFTTATNINGTNLLTVLLTDNGPSVFGGTNQSKQTFSLVVIPVNDPPLITSLSPVTTFEDTATNLTFVVTDIDSDPNTITVAASSTNAALFTGAGLTVLGSGTNRNVLISPQPNANGTSAINLVATDDQSDRSTNSFALLVQAVNDPPSFILATNLVVVTDTLGATIPNFAANIRAGPLDEAAQTLAFTVTTTNAPFYTVPPAIAPNGTLTFRPKISQGTNLISVVLTDTGGLAAGGTNASGVQSFSIVVGFANSNPTNPPPNSTLVNGSFETGNLAGWIAGDIVQPFLPVAVRSNGQGPGFAFFNSIATDGGFSATHGFDGEGPGKIRLSQDMLILPDAPILNFDYRAAWDLFSWGATLAREFRVTVEPAGGGSILQTSLILQAPPKSSTLDTGPLTASVDLSAFAGQRVRINFDAVVPEAFTGPAHLQLDNISFANFSRVGNRPPVARAGGPYVIRPGDPLTLDGTASSDVNAASGNGIANYFWDLDNDGLFDLTGPAPALDTSTLAGLGLGQPGSRTIGLQVQDPTGASGFATTTITITLPGAPQITTQPQSQSAGAGGTVTFNVTPGGTGPFTFQWKLNGSSLADNSRISGANSASLTISNVQTGDAGTYTVVVSNSAGSQPSSGGTLTVTGLPSSSTTAYTFTTLAGTPGIGSADGPASVARFSSPQGAALDNAGNLYVADANNRTIRKIRPDGVVSTLAGLAGSEGNIDGMGSAARFNSPRGIALDSAGNLLITDALKIRKISPAGMVSTVAGSGFFGNANGPVGTARFGTLGGIAVDGIGNIFVADMGNRTIRKITPDGIVSTLAGSGLSSGHADGTGSAARFSTPNGVAIDGSGNLYVTDSGSRTIRKITPTGVVSTIAGLAFNSGNADGTGSTARFSNPNGLVVDTANNLFVADSVRLRKITPAGVVSTIAGSVFGNLDGTGTGVQFGTLNGAAVDTAGNVYVADTGNNSVRKITLVGQVSTIAGTGPGSVDGTGSSARFRSPVSAAVDGAGNVYVSDSGNVTIRKVTPAGVVTTFAGSPGSSGETDGVGSAARFGSPQGVATDSAGNVYVADSGNGTIRKITPQGVVSTVAGRAGFYGSVDGIGSAATFVYPDSLAVDGAGNIYVAESVAHTIRKITPAGVVSTLAGLAIDLDEDGNLDGGSADGVGSAARFNFPAGISVDSAGNVYVADSGNHVIRKITPASAVTTFAGSAQDIDGDGFTDGGNADGTSAALFNNPSGLAIDSAGNLFVADFGNNMIRKITPGGMVMTIAASPGSGTTDEIGGVARAFSHVAVDSAGNLYVADFGSHTVRKGVPSSLPGIPNLPAEMLSTAPAFVLGTTPPSESLRRALDEVPIPPVLQVVRHGEKVHISVTTSIGKTFVVEYKDSLAESEWKVLIPVPGDGTTKVVIDPFATRPQRFYRVLVK